MDHNREDRYIVGFLKAIMRYWVPALIMASGAYFAATLEPVPQGEPAPDGSISSPDKPKDTPPVQFASRRMFGKWQEEFAKDTVYKAASDGFIAAYTGGNNPADGVLIYVGENQNKLAVLTRTGRYDGAVCPVGKDQYWMVKSNNGGRITVHWLPVFSENEES